MCVWCFNHQNKHPQAPSTKHTTSSMTNKQMGEGRRRRRKRKPNRSPLLDTASSEREGAWGSQPHTSNSPTRGPGTDQTIHSSHLWEAHTHTHTTVVVATSLHTHTHKRTNQQSTAHVLSIRPCLLFSAHHTHNTHTQHTCCSRLFTVHCSLCMQASQCTPPCCSTVVLCWCSLNKQAKARHHITTQRRLSKTHRLRIDWFLCVCSAQHHHQQQQQHMHNAQCTNLISQKHFAQKERANERNKKAHE